MGCEHFNCDLPALRARLADPEAFLSGRPAGTRAVLDEVHRAEGPASIPEIDDEFPEARLPATGSSSLLAGQKFRNSLHWRKWTLPLRPVLRRGHPDRLGAADLDRRLFHGAVLLLVSLAPALGGGLRDASSLARDAGGSPPGAKDRKPTIFDSCPTGAIIRFLR